MHLSTFLCSLVLVHSAAATFNITADSPYWLCAWKMNYPSDNTKADLIKSGNCITGNIFFTRFQSLGQYIFITSPRYKSGVPISLSRAMLGTDNYLVTSAYPNWAAQEEGNCKMIQSAVDVFLDKNGALWVLDAGVTNTMETPKTKCPPKIIKISTVSNSITSTFSLETLTTSSSNVQYLAVENQGRRNDFIYVADAGGKAIIVFDTGAGKARRFALPQEVNNVCSDTSALYLALLNNNDSNNLYFTYANCLNIFYIPTKSLINENQNQAVITVGKISKPIVFLGTNGRNQLYFRPREESDVYVWDTNTVLPPDNWKKVCSGKSERAATHVTLGPINREWLLESNIISYMKNTTGCMGDCAQLYPLPQPSLVERLSSLLIPS